MFGGEMEALGEILRVLRISTSIISNGNFSAPWSVSTRGATGAIFHAVISGGCFVRLTGGRRTKVEARPGDVALVSRGDPHVTCSDLSLSPVPVTSLQPVAGPGAVARVEGGGGGEQTEIICGSFELDHPAARQLLEMLPDLVLIPGGGERSRWFSATLQLLAADQGRPGLPGSVVTTRVAEALVAHLLQVHFMSLSSEAAGWLAGLKDERIGRALALIHTEPGTRWSAEGLAERVGMSRASFFSRFCALVGEPPVKYLTRWRMSTAADLLRREPDLPLVRVAGRVGYRSEEAFGRAFRRATGLTPREFRATSDIHALPA